MVHREGRRRGGGGGGEGRGEGKGRDGERGQVCSNSHSSYS